MTTGRALDFRPTRREAGYLGLLMLLVFLGLSLTLPSEPTGPDATTYLAIAREQLTVPDFWSNPESLVGNFWAVAYPTVLALFARVSGDDLRPILLVQAAMMASLVLVPWILARGLPKAVQLIAPALLAVTPALWWMAHSVGYEAMLAWLLGFGFAAAWVLYNRGFASSRGMTAAVAVASGLCLAGALLTQSKVLAVVPVVGFLLVRAGRMPVIAGALALLAGLLPWMIRNLVVLGTPNPLSGNGGYNLWVGNNPDAVNGGSMLIAPPTPPGETMTSAAVKFILSQPERWIELTFSKAARLLQPQFVYPDIVPIGPLRSALHLYAAALAVVVMVGVLTFVGAWLMRGSRSLPPVAPLAAGIVVWFAVHLPFIAEPRYMTTILPLTVTVAVAAWFVVVRRHASASGRSAAAQDHADVLALERRGMPVPVDLTVPGWRATSAVIDEACLEPSSTLTVPSQPCGLAEEQHSWPALQVRTLHNVLLDVDSGLAFTEGRVIAQSGTGTRAARDAAFVSGATFRVRELKPVVMAGCVAPLGDVHHHYHLMVETLPRVRHASTYRPDATFVTSAPVPERYMAVLDSWGVTVAQLPAGTVLAPEQLVLVDQPELFWPRSADLDALNEGFAHSPSGAGPDRFYISRRAASRAMTDEQAFEEALLPLGFASVALEELSVSRQVELFAGARVVIAPHGAGLSGVAFMAPGAAVLEVTSGELFENCYRRMAAIRGLDYRTVRVPGTPESPFGSLLDALPDVEDIVTRLG